MLPDIDSCRILEFQNQIDERGGLVIAETFKEIPFEIKRVFYSFNIPDRKSRGAHAHKHCWQVLIAPSGQFVVELRDSVRTKRVVMSDPLKGLLIPPGVWASELEFEPNAICLVLASELYDESDYIRSFDEYLKFVSERNER
ncbi:MAG: FdtA/QdtA family cupin domain-containing protein [Bacteroidaceae bacterium]|nr:FdtA/QdtA family cupin domain-containing protein [Bacteroidaceae bacterium]